MAEASRDSACIEYLLFAFMSLISMQAIQPPFLQYLHSNWVNSQLRQMTLAQKIGQLFQVAAFSNKGMAHVEHIISLIADYHIGGITFFQGDAQSQLRLTNTYQLFSQTPLFINIDAEWGLAMRLNGAPQFPYQMALGAIQEDTLIAEMGASLARQCKAMGVHSPLAPVADINNNPRNPVISFRSFGENKELVAGKAVVLMQALQQHNVLAVAKHFPGHGDTDTDSHLALPLLLHDEARIREVELYPFRQLIHAGLGAIMTAHLQVPALDDRPNMPATLSKKIITDLLRGEMGFRGLIITDAMDMKGITLHYPPGLADKLALMAGNDIITNSVSVAHGVREVQAAIASGELTEGWLEEKVRRILAMKEWCGLARWSAPQHDEGRQLMEEKAVTALNRQLATHALTLLMNEEALVAFQGARKKASLHIQCLEPQTIDASQAHHLRLMQQSGGFLHFSTLLKSKCGVEEAFYWSEKEGEASLEGIVEQLRAYNEVLLVFHGVHVKPHHHFGLPVQANEALNRLMLQQPVLLAFFGNAYALNQLSCAGEARAILLAYQENEYMHQAVAAVLAGKAVARGKLPVSLDKDFGATASGERPENSRIPSA